MSDLVQQVKDFFESDEGREYVLESTYKHIMQLKLMDKYMHYLNKLSVDERTELFAKIKKKYDSDEYYYRWIKRGFEPPETLYYYILEYGHRYGVVNEIPDSYFGYDSYIIDNKWIITAWYGQGTAYDLIKISN